MRRVLTRSKKCFCCSPDNPTGLNITFYSEDNKVFAEFIPDKNFGVSELALNPGIGFTVLIEAMGWAVACALQKPNVFTADFSARIQKPIGIGQKIFVVAEPVSVSTWISEASGVLKDEENNICIKATGKFIMGKVDDISIGDHIMPDWK